MGHHPRESDQAANQWEDSLHEFMNFSHFLGLSNLSGGQKQFGYVFWAIHIGSEKLILFRVVKARSREAARPSGQGEAHGHGPGLER